MSEKPTTAALPPGIEPLLTAAQVGAWLGISEWMVNEHRKAGRIAAVPVESADKPGGRRGINGYRYEPGAVRAFIDARRIVEGPDEAGGKKTRAPKVVLPEACGGVSRLRRKRSPSGP